MKKADSAYKIVIDTNVWVSFLIGKNLAGLHKYIYHKKIIVVTCREQLFELSEVFKKPKIRRYFPQSNINELFSLLDEVALFVELSVIPSICRDPKDDYLLALSIASDAHYLVTGDTDLLDMQQINNTKIIKYVDFNMAMNDKI